MRRRGLALAALAVGLAVLAVSMSNAVAARIKFSVPVVIGWTAGDDWEPDVAADGHGNVYVAWAHYGGVPGCDTCSSPSAMIQSSHDGGRTWGTPNPLGPFPRGPDGTYQVDLQEIGRAHV